MSSYYLFVGDDVSRLKIFEIINVFFNRNYKAWMKAWYDVNDDFAAWFPTITKTDDRPKGTFGGTQNCSNTLSEDRSTIIEIDHDDPENILHDSSKLDKKRLVFTRIDGKFYFLGIFSRTIIKQDGRTIKLHTKIADGINLQTFEMYKKID